MPPPLRMKRINDRIKEILSVVLLTKIEDPRLMDVSVTDVRVDRELDYANIYVSSLDKDADQDEILEALSRASGYLKYEISQEIDLRIMPKLRFFWDPTPQRADRIDALLAQIRAENEAKEATNEETIDSE
ncbi:MAG TPA: 30S ribosome-binding factor RbfA [Anaerolineaceae bacterium]|jgi:ribosome-binding factor A|nr:30S ribosome-binding factor RbfA [Anaerolineaceae bacterium]HNZ14393.1 30S ribosome-binding factor RbfA [Anaerolineaceae bacterium]HOH92655.1 30S ribosome-binding factor RbfA [Anaerolineaceae bacterium]